MSKLYICGTARSHRLNHIRGFSFTLADQGADTRQTQEDLGIGPFSTLSATPLPVQRTLKSYSNDRQTY